jgi:hypothetical protein
MADEEGAVAPGLTDYIRQLFRIESGGNPNAVTGSNRGLGQFGPSEERRYGISSANRTDPAVQAAAVARERAGNTAQLTRALGREPTFADHYLAHQQGLAGASALFSNPNIPAWQAIRPFYGSDAMAQRAITGNIPTGNPLSRLGVNDISSAGFAQMWQDRFNRGLTGATAPGGGALPSAGPGSVGGSPGLHTAAAAFNRPSNGDPFTAAGGSSTPPPQPAGSGLFGLGGQNPVASWLASRLQPNIAQPGQPGSIAPGASTSGMTQTPWGPMPAAPGGSSPATPAAGGNQFAQIKQIFDLLQKKQGFPFPDFKLAQLDTGGHPPPFQPRPLTSVLPPLPSNLPFAGNSGTGTG